VSDRYRLAGATTRTRQVHTERRWAGTPCFLTLFVRAPQILPLILPHPPKFFLLCFYNIGKEHAIKLSSML
jgi:hypothetical protein